MITEAIAAAQREILQFLAALPADHPLWSIKTVVITPHVAARSDLSRRNTLLIARENLRRYVRGEKLLNAVDLARGY